MASCRRETRKRGRNLSEGPSPSKSAPPTKRFTKQPNKSDSHINRKSTQDIRTPSVARNIVDDIIRIEEEEERRREVPEAEEDEVFATPTPPEMTTPDDSEARGALLKEMTQYFDQQFKKLPTREYMDERIGHIEKTAQTNTKRIEGIEESLRSLKNPQNNNQTTNWPSLPSRNGIQIRDERREEKFLLAKRSIRIWPIRGESTQEMTEGVDEFLKNGLMIEQSDLDTIVIVTIERMRTSPRAKHHHEVLVVFRDEDTRELVLSYSRNLSKYVDDNGQPTAGLRMEVPNFLASTQKLLQNVCVYLKQKYGQSRRIIKYDDIGMDLYIAFKLPSSDHWQRITSSMAATYRDREDQRHFADFSQLLSPPNNPGPRVLPATGANSVNLGTPMMQPGTSRVWKPAPRRSND